MTLLSAALGYAERGWRVFPCQPWTARDANGDPAGKKPMPGLKWQAEATTDTAKVREWWAKWPDANIGLVTGWPDGPGVVLDVDDRSLLEEVPERLTCDRASFTGKNGWHLFFALPPGVSIGNSIGNLPKGRADVRGCGSGYVLAPPSVHPNGEPYRWCKEAERPSVMPQWLLDVILGDREWRTSAQSCAPGGYSFDASKVRTAMPEPTPVVERARRWLEHAAPAVSGSGGHTTTFEVAQHLVRGFSLGVDEAARLMLEVWNPSCSPPWKPKDIERKCREARDKGSMPFGDKLHDSGAPDSPVLVPTSSRVTPESSSSPPPDWAEPEPLQAPNTLSPFPLDALPHWADEWVDAIAEATQTPPELAGMLVLVSASAALAKKAVVRIKRDWAEPLNLWVVVAMEPSSRKSPVFSAATAPLVEYEQEQASRKAHDIAMAHHRRDAEVARLKKLKAQLAKASDRHDQEDLLDQIDRQQKEIDKLDVPVAERLLAQDATMESLIGLMADNGGKIAVLSDEGGILGIAAGRYSSGQVNVDALLQGYSGGDIRVDRRGRESEYVKGAALTLGLTVQVEVLKEAFSNQAMRGRGLLARPMYVLPPSNVGRRRSALETTEVPEALAKVYRSGQMALCGLSTPQEPHDITLTPEAARLLARWDTNLEQEMGRGGKWRHIAEWAGKLVGGVARLAGVLHVSDSGPEGSIDERTMWRAIKLGNFLLEHAAAAFDAMADESEDRLAAQVLRNLAKHGDDGKTIRRRALHERVKGSFPRDKMRTFDTVMAELEDMGWIRSTKDGRAAAFVVHPELTAKVRILRVDCESTDSQSSASNEAALG